VRSLNVNFRLTIEFEQPLALDDRQLFDVREAIAAMNVSTIQVMAGPVYAEAA
jgi:hypothetical protein